MLVHWDDIFSIKKSKKTENCSRFKLVAPKRNQTESLYQYNKQTNKQHLYDFLLLRRKRRQAWTRMERTSHTCIPDCPFVQCICNMLKPFAFMVQLLHTVKQTQGKRENVATNYTLSSTTTVTLTAIFLLQVMCYSQFSLLKCNLKCMKCKIRRKLL